MQKHAFNKEADQACIAKWRELITRFNKLIENSPAPMSIQKELFQLSEDATSNLLNYRQTEAIQARVKNYLAARYGKTKEGVIYKAA